ADLSTLAVPTLLLWGDHDPVGSADAARRIEALIPHAELHVVDGGHAPWLGQPTQIATALVYWALRRHT
ncbi:MAG: alpha/beta fold hydrolase, partial [Jiangellales bacterium]